MGVECLRLFELVNVEAHHEHHKAVSHQTVSVSLFMVLCTVKNKFSPTTAK